MVYDPQEDSVLLKKNLPSQLEGQRVLDMGCGSGFLAVALAKKGAKVLAVDIDEEAITATQKAAKEADVLVEVRRSDLFEKVDELFACVVCNPPYLPIDDKDSDVALDGGKEGWEYIERFLLQAKSHLLPQGKIILLYSSHSNPEKLMQIFKREGFRVRTLAEKGVGFFETLFVVELTV